MPSEQRFSAQSSHSAVGSAGIFTVHLSREREACHPHKNALTLPVNEFLRVKVGAINTPSSSEPAGFLQGFLRSARYAVARIRSPHQRTGPHRAGRTYPARSSALGRAVIPLGLSDHLCEASVALDVRRRVYDGLPADQPVPAAELQHRLVPHDRRISSYISSYAAPSFRIKVARTGIFVPEVLVFLHRYSFLSMRLPNRRVHPGG